jgi:hypothetical protein
MGQLDATAGTCNLARTIFVYDSEETESNLREVNHDQPEQA